MRDTEIIEKYFNGLLNEEENALFEKQLQIDSDLLSEVAYYIQLQQALKNEQLLTRHAAWQRPKRKQVSFKTLISVAAILAVFVGGVWYWVLSPTLDLEDYADQYIQQELQMRSVQMSASQDSLQLALDLYNKGQLEESLTITEQLLKTQPDNAEQLELAGITHLRLNQYEKALSHFQRMENLDLYDNTAVFYQAITLLKRKSPLDVQEAEKLLLKVSNEHLGGNEYAKKWLKMR
jgi:tetratricopeptide (TPR) repeat protein